MSSQIDATLAADTSGSNAGKISVSKLRAQLAQAKVEIEALQQADVAHAGAADPHPIYLTQAEGDARYTTPSQVTSAIAQISAGSGWTPVLALVVDGERRVMQIADWTGGTGTKPGTGYVGSSGLVSTAAAAVDIRGAAGAAGGGSVSAVTPTYSADLTAGRAFTAADLGTVVVYNAAANASFTMPSDATLGITGSAAVEISVYMKGTGRPDVTGSGATVNKYGNAPTPAQFTVEVYQRVGANTWMLK